MLAGAGGLSVAFGSTDRDRTGCYCTRKSITGNFNGIINLIELSFFGPSLHLYRITGTAPRNGSGLREVPGVN